VERKIERVVHRTCFYAVVTCEMKPFQNYFRLRRCPTEREIILFQRVEIYLKLFQFFRSMLQLINIFRHVQCR